MTSAQVAMGESLKAATEKFFEEIGLHSGSLHSRTVCLAMLANPELQEDFEAACEERGIGLYEYVNTVLVEELEEERLEEVAKEVRREMRRAWQKAVGMSDEERREEAKRAFEEELERAWDRLWEDGLPEVTARVAALADLMDQEVVRQFEAACGGSALDAVRADVAREEAAR
jgi:hypothetical protein